MSALINLFVFVIILVGGCSPAAENFSIDLHRVTIEQLVANPDTYRNKKIEVTGYSRLSGISQKGWFIGSTHNMSISKMEITGFYYELYGNKGAPTDGFYGIHAFRFSGPKITIWKKAIELEEADSVLHPGQKITPRGFWRKSFLFPPGGYYLEVEIILSPEREA